MGWTWDTGYDPAYEHEGCAAAVLDDGTITGTHDGLTNGRFVGWRAACDCGWRGDRYWPREEVLSTDPEYAAQIERSPSAASIPPESVEGTEDGDGALAEWRAHLAVALPGLAVHDAATQLAAARDELERAVGTSRAAGASWTVIGEAAGLTRQSAHERWGAAYPPPPRTTAANATTTTSTRTAR